METEQKGRGVRSLRGFQEFHRRRCCFCWGKRTNLTDKKSAFKTNFLYYSVQFRLLRLEGLMKTPSHTQYSKHLDRPADGALVLPTTNLKASTMTPTFVAGMHQFSLDCLTNAINRQHFLGIDESMQYTPSETRVKESLLIVESDSLVEKAKRVIQTSSSLLEELSSGQLPHSIKAFYDHVTSAASNRVYQAELLGTTTLTEVTNGSTSIRDLEQVYNELQRLVDISEEILGTENRATREFRQLLQLTVYPGVEDSFAQQGFFDIEEVFYLSLTIILNQLQSDIRTRDPELLLRLSEQKLQIIIRRRKDEETQVIRRLGPSASLPTVSCHSSLEQVRWSDSDLGISSVEDVIHVIRKGRQSLTRQQHQEAQNTGLRHGSKRNTQLSHSLDRSDLAYRVSPYDSKVALATKYRVNGGVSNKKTARK
ncbi:hypothetical protein P3T76_002501 [Phytophthora citrophthora]|uniref:Uncharacterized protein n=1 Tax=Phytophthora citrophthora TaxID=4793 RepID=A0AAD9GWQ4_9STRA|nr:hypothetical protein P3T76_002501 [Phytophthora citrophthora]